MKTTSLLLVVISLFTFSCSDEDSIIPAPIPTEGNDIPTVYQPIKIANYWNYETQNIAVLPTPAAAVIAADKLLVDSDVVQNTFNYKKMKTEVAPTGFYGSMLNNNNLRIDGSSLKLTGTITTNLDASLPLEFNVNDFVIFKENGVANEVLSQTSPASFEDTTILPNNAKLTFVYSLKSTCLGNVAPMIVRGVTFNDIKKTRIEVNLQVILGEVATGITILQTQPVIISDQFYSKNIGVVQSNTVIEYEIDASSPVYAFVIGQGIPANGEQHINDFLSSYIIN